MIEQATTRTWMSDFTPGSDIPQSLSWRTEVSTRVVDEIARRLPEGMPDDDRRRTVYGALEGELRRLARRSGVSICDCAAGSLPVLVPFAESGLRWRWTGDDLRPPAGLGAAQPARVRHGRGGRDGRPATNGAAQADAPLVQGDRRGFTESGEHEGRYLLAVEDMPRLLRPRDGEERSRG
jgi:hypothetical protein